MTEARRRRNAARVELRALLVQREKLATELEYMQANRPGLFHSLLEGARVVAAIGVKVAGVVYGGGAGNILVKEAISGAAGAVSSHVLTYQKTGNYSDDLRVLTEFLNRTDHAIGKVSGRLRLDSVECQRLRGMSGPEVSQAYWKEVVGPALVGLVVVLLLVAAVLALS